MSIMTTFWAAIMAAAANEYPVGHGIFNNISTSEPSKKRRANVGATSNTAEIEAWNKAVEQRKQAKKGGRK